MARTRGSKDTKKSFVVVNSKCIGCGKAFTRTVNRKQSGTVKYCSYPCQRRSKHLRCTYKTTIEEINKVMERQNFCCSICGTSFDQLGEFEINIDHNHSTGKVRGVLCNNCNVGLGNFKDDINNLKSAIEYLEENNV